MEAKDTVMDEAKIWGVLRRYWLQPERDAGFVALSPDERDREIAQAQAEISFKAGIREVVEDMTTTLETARHNRTMASMWQCLQKWQAKLKEWGLSRSVSRHP